MTRRKRDPMELARAYGARVLADEPKNEDLEAAAFLEIFHPGMAQVQKEKLVRQLVPV